MSDYDSDEPIETPQEAAPQPPAVTPDGAEYWKAEAQKAFQARDTARQELRTQIQTGYDPEVVELVPQNLAPTEWKAYADKLVSFRGQATPNPTENVEPAEAQPEAEATTAQEQQLAAVAKGPSSTSASPPSGFTQDELLQIAMNDPERYSKLKDQGHGLQKLGDDPKYFGADR